MARLGGPATNGQAGPFVRRARHELDLVTTCSVLGWRGDRRCSGGLGVEVIADRAPGALGEGAG
jgi:hypothetical protein